MAEPADPEGEVEPTARQVEERVARALRTLLENDRYLLEVDINERSISHRLAIYLEAQFVGWHVDCEYNRNHHDPKRMILPSTSTSSADTDAHTVFPDIIVHHRDDDDNLLVVEMKKSTNPQSSDFDLTKLQGFRDQYRYRYAVFLRVRTGSTDVGFDEPKWV